MYAKTRSPFTVSVLIITKNRPQLFVNCLNSILNQKIQPEEVVIIDSSDQKLSINLSKPRSHIRHYYRPQLNIPQARQLAIKLAQSDLVMFVDDDCQISPDTITRFTRRFNHHPDIKLIMGKLINMNSQNPYAAMQHMFYEIWMQQNFTADKSHVQFQSGLPLCFDLLCARREFLLKAKFDLAAPKNFQDDDIDTGTKLFAISNQMYLDKDIIAHYHPRTTLVGLLKRNFYTGYSNSYLFYTQKLRLKSTPYHINLQQKISSVMMEANKLLNIYHKLLLIMVLPIYLVIYKIGWLWWRINNFQPFIPDNHSISQR